MNIQVIEVLRNILHEGSLVLLFIIGILVIIGLAKPHLLKRPLHDFACRRYIIGFGLFASLFAGTIFMATPESTSSFDSAQDNNNSAVAGALIMPDNIKDGTQEIEVIEKIPAPKENKLDSSLPAGESKLVSAGQEGEKKVLYTVTVVKKKEVARTVKSEHIITHPVPEIMAVSSPPATTPAQPTAPEKKLIPKEKLKAKKDNAKRCFIICLN